MNRRTLLLLVAAASVGLLWGADQVYRQWYEGPKNRLENQLDKLTRDLTKAQRAEVAGKAKTRELEYLVNYSLPYDPELARSAYQDWLLALVKNHGMENAAVDASQPRTITVPGRVRKGSRSVARQMTFGLRAKTDLPQLTAFLYDFYRAGHLHKITNLAVNPLAGGRAVDLNLTIEALSLEVCEREAELAQASWHRLTDQDLSAYTKLAQRNIFARGVTKSLAQVQLSGVTYNRSGVAEAWFIFGDNRPTSIVTAGQELQVDLVQLAVIEIQPTQVLLSLDGETLWLEVGERVGDKLGQRDPNVVARE